MEYGIILYGQQNNGLLENVQLLILEPGRYGSQKGGIYLYMELRVISDDLKIDYSGCSDWPRRFKSVLKTEEGFRRDSISDGL